MVNGFDQSFSLISYQLINNELITFIFIYIDVFQTEQYRKTCWHDSLLFIYNTNVFNINDWIWQFLGCISVHTRNTKIKMCISRTKLFSSYLSEYESYGLENVGVFLQMQQVWSTENIPLITRRFYNIIFFSAFIIHFFHLYNVKKLKLKV